MKINFTKFRELKRSVYNLFYYFNVIWNDRDWDHAYMHRLQLKKFKKAYKFRTESPYCMRCVGQEKQDQALRICINILEREINNWYTDVWWIHSNNCTKHFSMSPVEERDWKVYCKLIEKYQPTWWD